MELAERPSRQRAAATADANSSIDGAGGPGARCPARTAHLAAVDGSSGAGLAASLGRLDLIDEYQLFMQAVVLGGGRPFFEAGLLLNLRPVGREDVPQGVVALRARRLNRGKRARP